MASASSTAPTQETIAAIASAPGGAPRGIIRISGPAAIDAALAVFEQAQGEQAATQPATSTRTSAFVGHFLLPNSRRLPGQLLVWPTSRSYTREPVAELHTLGSPPLLDCLLRCICQNDVRLARPGEFTLRAFLAGRIDLTQAEAVLGVIDARGDAALRNALDQLAGGLSQPLNRLRDQLLDQLAHLEAGLDFVEEDIEFITRDELLDSLQKASQIVAEIAAQMTSRTSAVSATRVVLYGWPNAGKSSLFNALLGNREAIVADQPGTTRDYLSAEIEIHGTTCTLIDTAGIEPAAQDPLSQAAQSASDRQQHEAEIHVFCVDLSREINAWEEQQLVHESPVPRLIVGTKVDLAMPRPAPDDWVAISSTKGVGLEQLRSQLAELIAESLPGGTSVVATTAARCRESLTQAASALARGRVAAEQGIGEEFVAEELRSALESLAEVVGAVYTDDLLDRIFSRFCIGK